MGWVKALCAGLALTVLAGAAASADEPTVDAAQIAREAQERAREHVRQSREEIQRAQERARQRTEERAQERERERLVRVSTAVQEARTALERGLARHSERNYQPDRTLPDLVQTISSESAFIWPVYLRAGVNYRIYAACSEECSDTDMEIYGADGVLADRDVAGDDTPYVQITPTQSGRHFVRMWIYACSEDPCTLAARVLSGGRPAPRPMQEHGPRHEEVTGDSPQEVVVTELDDSGERQTSSGYVRFGGDVVKPLWSNSEGHRERVQLLAGRPYVFIGACDADCTDVDMEILDARGRQVAADVANDDRPVVAITPAAAGQYTIRIWLSQCSSDPCFVGVRSFWRAPGRRTPRASSTND